MKTLSVYPFLFFFIIVFTFLEATFSSWMIHDALREARDYNPNCSIYPIPLHKTAMTLIITSSFWSVLTASCWFLVSIGPNLTVAAGLKAKSSVCAWAILTTILWLASVICYQVAHAKAPLPGYSEESLGLPRGLVQGFAWASFIVCLLATIVAARLIFMEPPRQNRSPYMEKLGSQSWIPMVGSFRSK
ncbi:hypothetical protein FRC18_011808, partial [Serendipita sp. 400]